ncbi:MAG: hypothetical protein LBJ90_04990 [Treponema sp.]|jgi:hypothetical protein|nr:hypothetical protein [Treponema sp.]
MILTAKHLERIRKNAEKIDYGKITIMINGTGKYIDIITERRERVENEGPMENENSGSCE